MVVVGKDPPGNAALAARALRRVAEPEVVPTVSDMPAPMFLSRPLRSQGVASRPGADLRAAAKTISRVDPAIVVPAAADPAVLRLATGCVELAPAEIVEGGVLRPLKVDTQRRLRLTAGTKLLVTRPELGSGDAGRPTRAAFLWGHPQHRVSTQSGQCQARNVT